MKNHLSRRQFVGTTAASAAALVAFPSILRAQDTQKKITVGVIGLSRGMGHVLKYIEASNCEVGYLCDVDSRRVASGMNRAKGPLAKDSPCHHSDRGRRADCLVVQRLARTGRESDQLSRWRYRNLRGNHHSA